jgi:hypothetical protein
MKLTLIIERGRTEPRNDEVLVEGSWFPRDDLPAILGNHMRTADRYGRQLKEAHAKIADLQQSLIELRPARRDQEGSES